MNRVIKRIYTTIANSQTFFRLDNQADSGRAWLDVVAEVAAGMLPKLSQVVLRLLLRYVRFDPQCADAGIHSFSAVHSGLDRIIRRTFDRIPIIDLTPAGARTRAAR